MRHKRNNKKQPPKRSAPVPVTPKNAEPPAFKHEEGPSDPQLRPSSTDTSPAPSRSSTPSTNTSKTSFVRPSLALTKLQNTAANKAHEDDEEEVEEYSPNDPYYTSTVPQPQQYLHDPGIEPADPQVIEAWERNLRKRLEQAYPRMCYYFLCDKSLFVLVTLLTLRRIAKADMLSGRPVGSGRRDRQFVDDIAQCMSDAESRYDKDEECVSSGLDVEGD